MILLDPGERHVNGRIRTETVAAYIAEKIALKSAYKHASGVGVM